MKKILSKYNWHRGKELSCCGFLLEGDKHITGKGMEDYLISNFRKKGIESTLRKANGRFALVGEKKDFCVAACDSLRTYPLFYHKSGNNILISDSAHSLLDELNNPSLDKSAVVELLLCGFTLNNQTLISEIKQVRAGEYISCDTGINTHEYHNFAGYLKPDSNQTEAGFTTLPGILEEVFRTSLSALNNRPVVLPLSGGYDSRLIAVMLKRYYSGKVITFTYGSKSNPEFRIASKVAKKLNLEWIPVVYDNNLTRGYITNKTFASFYKYSSELSSIFFFQDYFAVKHLVDNNLIPPDSVFIPGHTGDILSGGHTSPGMDRFWTPGNISSVISDLFFNYIKSDKKSKREISNSIVQRLTGKNIPAYREIENWEFKERQSKMIINSASVFSFFGYEWIIPFWDKSLIDFFGSLDFEDKLHSKLYRQVLAEDFFSTYDLNFENELKPTASQYRRQMIKDSIKRHLPSSIINIFTGKNDPYHYSYITKLLEKEISPEYKIPLRQDNYYNAHIAQYLVSKTSDLINRS